MACLASERRAAAKEDEDVGDGGPAPAEVVRGARGVARPRGGTVAVVLTPLLLSTTPPPLVMLMLVLLLLLLALLALLTPAAAAAAAATAAAAADPGGRRCGGMLGGFPLTPARERGREGVRAPLLQEKSFLNTCRLPRSSRSEAVAAKLPCEPCNWRRRPVVEGVGECLRGSGGLGRW